MLEHFGTLYSRFFASIKKSQIIDIIFIENHTLIIQHNLNTHICN